MSNVKKLRVSKGWTQQELADKIGVSRITIVNIENHFYANVKSQIIDDLCEIFDVNAIKLLGIDNLKRLPETKEELEWLIEELHKELEEWDLEKK